MKSDVGTRYFDGLVVSDELVWTLLYAGKVDANGRSREKWVQYRATVVRPDNRQEARANELLR